VRIVGLLKIMLIKIIIGVLLTGFGQAADKKVKETCGCKKICSGKVMHCGVAICAREHHVRRTKT
jgi:hypothetical protein